MLPLLTVAIPTYNRAAKLRIQLDNLASQLTPETQCIIFDNASTDATPKIAKSAQSPRVSYFQAAQNTGLVGNIIRCFENCSTEWLWILGDDDPISPEAIARALPLIRGAVQYDFIHHSTPLWRYHSDTVVKNPRELLQKSTLPSLVWISTGLYRTS